VPTLAVGRPMMNIGTTKYWKWSVRIRTRRDVFSTGTRYELRSEWRSQNATFVETNVNFEPHMRGLDHLNVSVAGIAFERSKGEDARMLDISSAFGIVRGPFEYALGLRWVDFSANFADGNATDRNVGFGPTVEVRYSL